MAFLLNSQAEGPVYLAKMNNLPKHLRGAPEARGPMQMHRLKAGPVGRRNAGPPSARGPIGSNRSNRPTSTSDLRLTRVD